jgi:ketosteroid isomerase-like protein
MTDPDPALAIPNLLYRYADAIDAGDFDGAAKLFRHGHVIVSGKRVSGDDAIAGMWREWVQMYPTGTPLTRHLITNPIIELDDSGMSAFCRSQWTILQATQGLPLQAIATGRYHDRFSLIQGQWCFTERNYAQIDLAGDTSHHLRKKLAEEAK